MSYEGYEEYLCENGHYHSRDCNDRAMIRCPDCKKPMVFRHSVDLTNGSFDDVPSTMAAPKKKIGFDDRWCKDHYGNQYAVKIAKYRPAGKQIWVIYRRRFGSGELKALCLENIHSGQRIGLRLHQQ